MGELFGDLSASYAVCTFIGGILQFLSLSPGMKKTMRFIVTAAVIAAVAVPLAETGEGFTGFSYETETDEVFLENDALMHTAHVMEKNIYTHVSETLINLGVDEYEIYIGTDTQSQTDTVILTSVKIEVAEKYEMLLPQIYEILKNEYGEVLETDVKKQQY